MIRTIIRRAVFIIVIAALLLAGVWQVWWRAVPVAAFEVNYTDLTVETMGTGTLEARVSSIISAKIQGRIVELAADQGDIVEHGQILVRLDDSDLQRQVDVAEATVEMNRAALDRLRTEQRRSEIVLRQARLEHDRTLDAYAKGAATTTERDRAIERLEIAEAELARAEAAIVEAQKAMVAAERSLDHRRSQLDDTIIRSPIRGMIVRRDRDRGDVVVPGSSIYRLVETGTLWVSAWVDETAMAGLEVNQPARVVFRAQPHHSNRGHVARLGREVDPELREFIVDVVVDELPATWAVGQRAEVYITTERVERALTIPAEFLMVRDGITGVWVSKNDRAAWQPCEVGLRGRTMIEITDGLDAGDLVLRPIDARAERMLRTGRKVVVR